VQCSSEVGDKTNQLFSAIVYTKSISLKSEEKGREENGFRSIVGPVAVKCSTITARRGSNVKLKSYCRKKINIPIISSWNADKSI
jgi:hypothetical protein